MREHPAPGEKRVFWVGSSKRDLLCFIAFRRNHLAAFGLHSRTWI